MLIQPRNQAHAFNLTAPARPGGELHGFPASPLAGAGQAAGPLAPGLGDPDNGLELDRLLGSLAAAAIEHRQFRSSGELALDTVQSEGSSRLSSVGQLNDAATSYQKVRLTFGDSSTVATLRGTYAAAGAAASATSLKIEFTENATIGYSSGTLKFQVLDQNGTELFSYNGTARAGETLSLGADIGLTVAFSAGTAQSGAWSRTTVSASAPTTVDTNARFNDPNLNNRPRFQDGAQVVAGRFLVNGSAIDVRADDTVASVLQRISETLPNLTATVSGDKVVLESRFPSTRDISVSDDTSGFLTAVGLRGAVTDRGHVRGDREPLAQLAQFATVRAGGFTANGRYIAIDPTTDTLAGTLARIRDFAASVQVYYDSSQRAVFLREPVGGTTLADDTSGFLTAVGINRESSPSLEPPLQLAPTIGQGVAQRIARLLDGNLAGLAAESQREPDAPSPRDAPGPARKAQAAYQRTVTEKPGTTEARTSWVTEDRGPVALGIHSSGRPLQLRAGRWDSSRAICRQAGNSATTPSCSSRVVSRVMPAPT